LRVYTLKETVVEAAETLRLFSDEPALYYPTGLAPIDDTLGGLFPGQIAILAADTGVGKSRLVLGACIASPTPSGILCFEDGPETMGARALAGCAKVDSRRMLRKHLDPLYPQEVGAIEQAFRDFPEDNIRVVFPKSRNLDGLRKGVEALCASGSKVIWFDYIQKLGGSGMDRRGEIDTFFRTFHESCDEAGVAGIVISQFKRREPRKGGSLPEPQLNDLKESGDLENAARFVVLCWADESMGTVNARVAKSTFGGGRRYYYRTAPSGMLEEI